MTCLAARNSRITWGVCALVWAATSAAAARRGWAQAGDGDQEAIRLEYVAPAGCPGRDAFAGQLRARTHGVREATGGEPAREFRAEISQSAGRFGGGLVVREPDGASYRRQVTGASCEEVVDALALITALAIDPTAATRAEPPAPPELPVARERAVASAVSKSAPGGPTARTGNTLSARGSSRASRWRIGLGAAAGATRGVAPNVMFPSGLFVSVGRPDAALAWRLGAAFARTTDTSSVARARFDWWLASVDYCPLALGPVHACARVEGGVLRAAGAGVQIDNARDARRPWLAPGVTLGVSTHLWRGWFTSLEGQAAFPLVRDRFLFEPDRTIHRVPAVTFGARLFLGTFL